VVEVAARGSLGFDFGRGLVDDDRLLRGMWVDCAVELRIGVYDEQPPDAGTEPSGSKLIIRPPKDPPCVPSIALAS
jgi:hypothetical protein